MQPGTGEPGRARPGRTAPLRILMIAPEPFFTPRGTPFSVLHRIRALTLAGHRVDLVTYPFGEDVELPGLRILRCRRPAGVSDVRVGPSVAKLVVDLRLYRKARQVVGERRYDFVHTHEEAAFFGVGLARRHGIPHVYDMHSSLPEQLNNFDSFDWRPIRALFTRLEDHALRNSLGVITVCPELAEIVERKAPDAIHAMIENTGDDTAVFEPVERDVRDEFNLTSKQLVVYAGTLEPYQGIDLLIAAASSFGDLCPDAHLLVVGGRPDQVEALRAQAAARGVEGRITFVGLVPPSHIPAFVGAADLIVSSRTRGTNTPGKIYAYMGSGRPLLATRVPSHTQVLDDSVAHLVEPEPDAIAEGISRILGDVEYGRGLARAAAEKARNEFGEARYASAVKDFYDRLVSGLRSPAGASPAPLSGS